MTLACKIAYLHTGANIPTAADWPRPFYARPAKIPTSRKMPERNWQARQGLTTPPPSPPRTAKSGHILYHAITCTYLFSVTGATYLVFTHTHMEIPRIRTCLTHSCARCISYLPQDLPKVVTYLSRYFLYYLPHCPWASIAFPYSHSDSPRLEQPTVTIRNAQAHGTAGQCRAMPGIRRHPESSDA
ncbi:hypothetical protein F4780DRAFT_477979 [Xylariomycetidae sp. FL0641]|nr:hypothetical protein F4780DRAFT_477979 [Xylariomycetidae sp. FL0641]